MISNPSLNSNWSYSLETLNLGQNWRFFVPCDFEIWWMTLENNRSPLLYYTKLCASFQSHGWIQTWVTVQKLNWGQNLWFFVPCDHENWRITLKNNRTPLLCYFKLCASFLSHWWIQTGATVWKRLIWVKINFLFSHMTWNLMDDLEKQ